MPTPTCIDDPAALLRPECLQTVSKDVEGKLTLPKPKLLQCSKPACETLVTLQSLRVQTMEGRLCGKAIDAGDPRLKGCQVIGVYGLRFTATEKGATGGVMGVIEAVIMCPCRQ